MRDKKGAGGHCTWWAAVVWWQVCVKCVGICERGCAISIIFHARFAGAVVRRLVVCAAVEIIVDPGTGAAFCMVPVRWPRIVVAVCCCFTGEQGDECKGGGERGAAGVAGRERGRTRSPTRERKHCRQQRRACLAETAPRHRWPSAASHVGGRVSSAAATQPALRNTIHGRWAGPRCTDSVDDLARRSSEVRGDRPREITIHRPSTSSHLCGV